MAACIHAVVAIALLAGFHGTGQVRVLSAVGMRQVMLELGPRFERATGHVLAITFESSGLVAKRLQSGDIADVVIVNQAAIDRLTGDRRIAAGSAVPLATSRVGVAVRRGAAKPDISTTVAFTQAMMAARRVSYPDPALEGSSGVHLARVFERLGIAAAMKTKTIYAEPPGPSAETPGSLVVSRQADIALHQMQELMAVRGLDIVGPLPDDLQETFTFSAAIVGGAADAAAAKALVDFLRTAEARSIVVAKGMGTPGQ